MNNFRIGQRVVCVNGTGWFDGYGTEILPVTGGVYTIRSLSKRHDGIGLCLEEIRNPPLLYSSGLMEASFLVSRFRPVRDTSIEIFERMLNPGPLEVA